MHLLSFAREERRGKSPSLTRVQARMVIFRVNDVVLPCRAECFPRLETSLAERQPGRSAVLGCVFDPNDPGCIRERDLKFRSLLFEATQNIYSTPAVGGQPDFNPNNRPSLFTPLTR